MVTKKIEDASETVNNFDYSMSTSIPSVSSVIVVSKYGVDYDEVWAELSQKLSAIQSELPENCQDIVIDTELMDTAGAILAISDNTANTETLESYSRNLKNQLEGVNGIKRVEILGTQDKQVTVEVNSANLDMLSVDMRDVGNIIASSAVSFPLGKLEDGGSK
ncbi:Acriflavin resistance protein like protein, partial [Aduncisulcus paluster]